MLIRTMLKKLKDENLRTSLSVMFVPLGVAIVGGIVDAFFHTVSRTKHEDTVDDDFGSLVGFWYNTPGLCHKSIRYRLL